MQELSKEEIQTQIVYSIISNMVNTGEGAEIKDIANECVKALQQAEVGIDVSSEFINSIFNFHNVYRPLYDLLDLSTNGELRGKKMTDDYRNGIVDAILAMKKYERFHGFGDNLWTIDYNTVSGGVYDKNMQGYKDVTKQFE
jgi:hypothetical protein